MYQRKSRLNPKQKGGLMKLFVAGCTARAAAEVIGVNRNTSTDHFMRLRKLIATKLPSYELTGEIEADESYFGGKSKGLRGRGVAGKVAVFGLLKRGGKVFATVIPNAKTATLLPIIEGNVMPDSIVYTDTFKAYDALDVSNFHHIRNNHSKLFADRANYINGLENFWNQAKRHLRRLNGIKNENFYWFLKEFEWRFNGGDHSMLLKKLRIWAKISNS